MGKIRVALVGATGHFFILHCLGVVDELKEYTDEGLELVACASDGYHPGVHPAAEKKSCPVFRDYRAMLDEVRPDVVSLGCWYAHNGEAALECLRRGIHVLSEKPPLNSWTELSEASRLTREKELHFLTEFDQRSNPLFKAAARAVGDGVIGHPVLVQAQKSYRFGQKRPDFYRSRKHYGGTLTWVASHIIDTVTWCTGLDYLSFNSLQGNIAYPGYGEMEDHVAILARMEKGVSAVLTADFLNPAAAAEHGDNRLRIAGSRGVVEVIGKECRLTTENRPATVIERLGKEVPRAALEFVRTLRGEGDGTYSTAETLRVARFLLAARDSADQGREISMAGLPGKSRAEK